MMSIQPSQREKPHMSVPQIYKEFFHQVRQVETNIRVWKESDRFQGSPLEAVFHFDAPAIKGEKELSFGEFISAANELAQRYGVEIRPPEDSIKDVPIGGKALYAMAMHIMNRARSQSKDLGQMEQLVPVVKDFVSLVESFISFEHPEPRQHFKFNDFYVMNAKMGLRHIYDHLELFSEEEALAMAEKTEKKITELFGSLPGEFQDHMTSFAIILDAGNHGRHQGRKLKAAAEPAGPGL